MQPQCPFTLLRLIFLIIFQNQRTLISTYPTSSQVWGVQSGSTQLYTDVSIGDLYSSLLHSALLAADHLARAVRPLRVSAISRHTRPGHVPTRSQWTRDTRRQDTVRPHSWWAESDTCHVTELVTMVVALRTSWALASLLLASCLALGHAKELFKR